MRTYAVEVVIENKPVARDPEGESIQRDLILRGGYAQVESVRTGRYLRLMVKARSPEEAQKIVFDLCNNLRIYNPVVHTCRIEVRG